MFRKLVKISKNQRGFTILELLIAVAITGLIIGGIALTIIQLFEGHAQSSGEMTALRQVQNAGYHISRDVQHAHTSNINTDDNPETLDITEILTITWTEITSWKTEDLGEGEDLIENVISKIIRHKIVYTLDDEKLDRNDYRTDEIREDDPIEYSLYRVTRVAEYITVCEYDDLYDILTVTAKTGGFKSQIETRTYEIDARSDTIYWQE
ncbi:type II secretion system protein J [Chloroflexota bacterium]